MIEEQTALEKVEVIKKDVSVFVQQGEAITVTSDEDMATATDYLGLLKDRWKRIEEIRTGFTKPLNDHIGKLNTMFKSQQSPLKEVEIKVKALMGAFYTQKAKEVELARLEAEKVQKKAELEAEKKGVVVTPAPDMTEPVKTSVKTTQATSSMKKVWKFEVVDENKVPKEYLMVDEKKIREAVGLGMREIEGIKIFEKTEVAIR